MTLNCQNSYAVTDNPKSNLLGVQRSAYAILTYLFVRLGMCILWFVLTAKSSQADCECVRSGSDTASGWILRLDK